MRTTPRGTPATLLQPGRFDGCVWMGVSPIFLSGPVDLLHVSCDIGADWVAFDPRRISPFPLCAITVDTHLCCRGAGSETPRSRSCRFSTNGIDTDSHETHFL